ncbi:laccase domain-containing protein [bacterium]|nr:laccase domain-containing protein [bacterium]
MIQSPRYSILFLDKIVSLPACQYHAKKIGMQGQDITSLLRAQDFFILDQEHSTVGYNVSHEHESVFEKKGDFLFTSTPGQVLSVITADCVPVLFYHKAGIVGAVHAGWKGSYLSIFDFVMHALYTDFGVLNIADFVFYIGPAAQWCCYQVQQDFVDTFIKEHPWSADCFVFEKQNWWFDNRLFCRRFLQKIGIPAQNIYTENVCTICSDAYHSFRREKENSGRNISAIVLHQSAE